MMHPAVSLWDEMPLPDATSTEIGAVADVPLRDALRSRSSSLERTSLNCGARPDCQGRAAAFRGWK